MTSAAPRGGQARLRVRPGVAGVVHFDIGPGEHSGELWADVTEARRGLTGDTAAVVVTVAAGTGSDPVPAEDCLTAADWAGERSVLSLAVVTDDLCGCAVALAAGADLCLTDPAVCWSLRHDGRVSLVAAALMARRVPPGPLVRAALDDELDTAVLGACGAVDLAEPGRLAARVVELARAAADLGPAGIASLKAALRPVPRGDLADLLDSLHRDAQ